MTACDLAEETFTNNVVWGSDDSTCARGSDDNDPDKDQYPGMCPASCQADISALIAACDECALADVVCDAPVDLGRIPVWRAGTSASSTGRPWSWPARTAPIATTSRATATRTWTKTRTSRASRATSRTSCSAPTGTSLFRTLTVGSRAIITAKARPRSAAVAVRRTGRSPASSSPWRRTSRVSSRARAARSFDAAASLTSLAGATSQVTTKYSDLDSELVPDDMKVRFPYGDNGLFDVMSLWGPEGCRYPYYGYLPDAPLCDECSSMFEAKEDILNGLWDGPCNSKTRRWDDDSLPPPPNYPGCGCDCADFFFAATLHVLVRRASTRNTPVPSAAAPTSVGTRPRLRMAAPTPTATGPSTRPGASVPRRRRRGPGRLRAVLRDTGRPNRLAYAATDLPAYAAPDARADNTADAWSFAGADAAPHTRADDARPFAGADARADAISNSGQAASSVTLEGIVATEFNADEGMKALAQSILDSAGGAFDEVIDIEAAGSAAPR